MHTVLILLSQFVYYGSPFLMNQLYGRTGVETDVLSLCCSLQQFYICGLAAEQTDTPVATTIYTPRDTTNHFGSRNNNKWLTSEKTRRLWSL